MSTDTTPAPIGADAMRKELIADLREVFYASGQETPQIVRDVIEYADSWLRVYIQRGAASATQAAPSSHERDEAINILVRFAEGQTTHNYSGDCPSDESPKSRDPQCMVCWAIDAIRAGQEKG